MRIGVFGDSFAAERSLDGRRPWWKFLEAVGGHTVVSHGVPGSSIIYSAEMIQRLGKKYDFIIWCVTDTTRMTTATDDGSYLHFSLGRTGVGFDKDDPHHQKLRDIAFEYQKYFEHSVYLQLTTIAILEYITKRFDKKLMMIPCFPLFTKATGLGGDFNLVTVARNEIQCWGQDPATVYAEYTELRATHLCENNNRILAELVNAKLEPGIFTANYDQFQPPDAPFDYYFQKRLS